MKALLFSLLVSLPLLMIAQPNGNLASLTPTQRLAAQQQVLNGNDSLNRIYTKTACGLNYTQATVRLGQRFLPIGVPQPAPITLTGLPGCATVDTAFIWFELLGTTPPAPILTVTNPQGQTLTVQSQLIGSSIDVCWGMIGTHVYRAEVTSIVSSNGTYTINGIPVTPNFSAPNAVDAEGATLLVVYQDRTASYNGTLIIDDGAATVAGGALNHTITGLTPCTNSTAGSAFMIAGDFQYDDVMQFNGNPVPFQFNWWNYITDTAVQVQSTQTSFSFDMNSGGDCYTFAVAGLYYQDNCNSCTALSNGLQLTTSTTPATCNNNGSASVTSVTGGTGPYTYLWSTNPAQTTATASNLLPGTYYVQVNDSVSCGSAILVVANAGVSATLTSTPACTLTTLTPTITGGTPPYSYLWMPGGQTTATLPNISATGSYWLVVTDANGCSFTTAPIYVQLPLPLGFQLYTTPEYCQTLGSVTTTIYSGQGPYSYAWSNAATTADLLGVPAGTYSVVITDANNCIDTASAVVNPAAPLQFVALPPDTVSVPCFSQVYLYVNANDPNATYTWMPGNISGPTYLQSPTATGSFTVSVTAINACDTLTDTTLVIINATPPPPNELCGVSVVQLTNDYVVSWNNANAAIVDHYDVYKEVPYTSGNFTLVSSQLSSVVSVYVDTTSDATVSPERYRVVLFDLCGQASVASAVHGGISLSMTPLSPQGTQLNWTAYQGPGLYWQAVMRGSSPTNLTQFAILATTDTSFVDTTAGTWYYAIEVAPITGLCLVQRLTTPVPMSNGPIRSNIMPDVTALGVNEPTSTIEQLSIAPNPGNGQFAYTFTSSTQVTRLRVLNVMGQEVWNQQLNAPAGVVRGELDLRTLPAGIYLLQLSSGNAVTTARVVIRH